MVKHYESIMNKVAKENFKNEENYKITTIRWFQL